MELIDFILHVDDHLLEFIANYGVWIYAILFLIIFVETGLVVMPFLPGDSLWRNFNRQQLISVCHQDQPGSRSLSPRCAHALGSSEKAQRQWQLEAAFRLFERDPLWRKR